MFWKIFYWIFQDVLLLCHMIAILWIKLSIIYLYLKVRELSRISPGNYSDYRAYEDSASKASNHVKKNVKKDWKKR